jgi:DNA mismatch repair protein MutS2
LPVAEALLRLDRYLDEAFIAGLITVRVVHGKGTGTLRAAVREALSAHPLVRGYREGYIGEGDAGVTVVEMEDRY